MFNRSVAPRQRSTSRSTSKSEDACEHHVPFVPGLDRHASRLEHAQRQDPLEYDQTYADYRIDFSHRSPPTGYQELPNHHMDDDIYPVSGAATSGKASSPPEWSPGVQYEVARETSGRKTGCASISDSSEATTSSGSDVSMPPVNVDDLQRLSLGDHPASHMMLPYGASGHSRRNDPILGDVQRKYEREVVSGESFLFG